LQDIKADSVDAAAEQILDQLKAHTSTEGRSKGSVIYFDGWDGLGASAVLRAVAQRLSSSSDAPEGLRFDKIIHINCLKWESTRALQRAIAEQLQLPPEVMQMLNRQDEEDDYDGLDQGSRLGIPQVQWEMHRRIKDLSCRFLVRLPYVRVPRQ
jgi:Cdc6-like AAA superfamily ATPase